MIEIGKKTWRFNFDDFINADKAYSRNHINCYVDLNKTTSKVATSYVFKSYQKTNLFDVNKIQEIPGPEFGFLYSKNVAYKMLALHLKGNYPYIYMDNSYFSKFYDQKISRFRIILNNIHPQKLTDHINSDSKMILEPWKKRNDDDLFILICPPTGEVIKLFGVEDDWLFETVKKIRQKTNRMILIRFKSYDYVDLKKEKYLSKLSERFKNIYYDKIITDMDLLDVFEDCYAVVAPASGVGVIAASKGIPVFSEKFGPISYISCHDYLNINDPIYPNRDNWLNMILNHEFSLEDIYNGKWLVKLKLIYPKESRKILDEKINLF